MFFRKLKRRLDKAEISLKFAEKALEQQGKDLRRACDKINDLNIQLTGVSNNPFEMYLGPAIATQVRELKLDMKVMKAHFGLEINREPKKSEIFSVKECGTDIEVEVS
jgi:hypothetical protein